MCLEGGCRCRWTLFGKLAWSERKDAQRIKCASFLLLILPPLQGQHYLMSFSPHHTWRAWEIGFTRHQSSEIRRMNRPTGKSMFNSFMFIDSCPFPSFHRASGLWMATESKARTKHTRYPLNETDEAHNYLWILLFNHSDFTDC